MKSIINHILAWVLLLTMTVFYSSCVTQKACNRKFPPTVVDHHTDKTVSKSREKDSTHVSVTPQQEFKMTDSVNCPGLNKSGSYRIGGILFQYEIKDGKLYLNGNIPKSETVYRDRWHTDTLYREIDRDRVVQLPPIVEYKLSWRHKLAIVMMAIVTMVSLWKALFKK